MQHWKLFKPQSSNRLMDFRLCLGKNVVRLLYSSFLSQRWSSSCTVCSWSVSFVTELWFRFFNQKCIRFDSSVGFDGSQCSTMYYSLAHTVTYRRFHSQPQIAQRGSSCLTVGVGDLILCSLLLGSKIQLLDLLLLWKVDEGIITNHCLSLSLSWTISGDSSPPPKLLRFLWIDLIVEPL